MPISWGTVFKGIGTGLQIIGEQRQARQNSQWAEFTRDRDILDLGAVLADLEGKEVIIQSRLNAIGTTDVPGPRLIELNARETQLIATRDFHTAQRDHYLKDASSRATEFVNTRTAEINEAITNIDTRLETNRFARRALSAKLVEVATRAESREDVLDARIQGAELAEIGLLAERRALSVEFNTKMDELAEDADVARGQVTATAQARGFAGSAQQTGRAAITRREDRARAVATLGFAAGTARLDEQAGRLGIERADIAADRAIGAAQDETERLNIETAQTRLAGETSVLGRQRRTLKIKESYIGEHEDRILAEGALRAAGASVSALGAETSLRGVDSQRAALGIERQGLQHAGEMIDVNQEIGKWQLKNMPDVGNYEGQANLSAAGHILTFASTL